MNGPRARIECPGDARQYTINNDNVAKSAEKLSSGYRINRAGDDAAGLAISEKMRSQIRGLNMATKNSQDAISLVQTAEGALQETQNMLQRMNELAVQAATGTNQEIDRNALAKEFEQLKREINDVAQQTTFNNMNVLDGSLSYKGYQRSAATSGMNVTKPAPLENSTSAGATPGGTATIATGLTMSDAPTTDITFTVKYTDASGTEGTVELTNTTAIAAGNSTALSTLAANGMEFASADGKWTGTLDAQGNLSLTMADGTVFKDGDAISAELKTGTGTGLTAPAQAGTGTVTSADAAKAAEEAAAAEGTKASATFTIPNNATVVTNAGELQLTVSIGGQTGTVATTTLSANTAPAKADIVDAFDGKTVTVGDKDYSLSKDASGNLVLTAPEAVADEDLSGATISIAVAGGNTGTAANMPANAAAASDVKGVAPVEADEASDMPASTVKREGTWTLEVDTSKMTVGDTFSVTIGDETVEGIVYNGEDNDAFAALIAGKFTGLGTGEGNKGSAVLANSEITVKLTTPGEPAKEANAMLIQVGALEKEQLAISIDAMNTKGLNLDDVTLDDQTLSGKAITRVRDAINKVSDQRATLGAMQNRLEHKIANLKVSSENLSAAESRIRDIDMAEEMTNFTKNNILSQAATAMLAQANALPQNVLSLLG